MKIFFILLTLTLTYARPMHVYIKPVHVYIKPVPNLPILPMVEITCNGWKARK